MPLLNVQKIKLQLFHRLQRQNRDAWKFYWGSFQLYLSAKLSLEEFHALAEELLGPDKHLHNKLVMSLLSTVYQEAGDEELQRSLQSPLALEIQDHRGEERREDNAADGYYSMSSSKDPLLKYIKKEGTEYDSEQRQQKPLGRKRPYSSIVPAKETTANKLMHLGGDRSLDSDHPDHQSAQLLMGLGILATTINPSSIATTPVSTPSNSSRGLESRVSKASRRE